MRPHRVASAGASFGRLRRALLLASLALLAWPAAAPAAARAKPSVVARATTRSVAVYRYPGARRPYLRLRNPRRDGAPLVFLVVQRLPGWERVALPVRPNGSTGWIRDRQVALALDPYRVVVSLRRHSVSVFRSGRLVRRAKAGVGRSTLPTPRGTYYIVELLRQPDPRGEYGPYAFGLSAFSNVLYRFGGGPGEIGLHGTNYPAGLGTDVSHGCIRVGNAAITALAHMLPLGTPVTIVR